MDHTGQPGVLPVPRRRRSKPKPKAQPSGLIGVLRTRLFGRGLAAVMAFITAVYVWQVWRMIEPSGQRLGSLELGMDLREVRTAMGGESGIETGSASLAFDRDGRVFTVHLGGPERQPGCRAPRMGRFCAALLSARECWHAALSFFCHARAVWSDRVAAGLCRGVRLGVLAMVGLPALETPAT